MSLPENANCAAASALSNFIAALHLASCCSMHHLIMLSPSQHVLDQYGHVEQCMRKPVCCLSPYPAGDVPAEPDPLVSLASSTYLNIETTRAVRRRATGLNVRKFDACHGHHDFNADICPPEQKPGQAALKISKPIWIAECDRMNACGLRLMSAGWSNLQCWRSYWAVFNANAANTNQAEKALSATLMAVKIAVC